MAARCVGVLALQGAFREHVAAVSRLGVAAREVRQLKDMDGIDAMIIPGGESTTIYRSGTPTVALAASLETALNSAVNELPERSARVKEANLYLRTALSKYPKVRINSPESAIPHILNLSVENVKGTVFQRELDAEGVCVSVKSACSSDGLPSRAVFAVSRDRRNALSSWRISLSHLTTEEELNGFLAAFDRCLKDLQKEK